MKKEILFGYRLSNSDCCEDDVDDDGFSLDIYNDGTAIYQEYVFSDIPKKCGKFKVSDKTISEINAIFDRYNNKISRLDKSLDNNSVYDGVFNKFIFRGKKITSSDICEHKINQIAIINPEYFIKYYKIMVQENIIMKIFREICSVLRKNHAIRLKLESAFIPLWLFIGGNKNEI